jgi:hypothetical protein
LSSIVVAGDTSGSVTLSAPAVAGSTVLTLPSVSGTVLTSASSQVTGPAFSAYASAVQSLTNGAFNVMTINTKEFDTATAFNTSTYAFTPTVAGYYQVNGQVNFANTVALCFCGILKNAGRYKDGSWVNQTGNPASVVSSIVYLNGSTDYINLFGYQSSGVALNTNNFGNTYANYFNATLVRAA